MFTEQAPGGQALVLKRNSRRFALLIALACPLGGTASADQFSVAGEANAAFSIASTSGTVSSGSNSMAFTTAPSLTTTSLSLGGTGAFNIGGTLTATGSEPAGSYTGSYDVNVAYN